MRRTNTPGILLFFLLIIFPFSAGLVYALLYSFGFIGVLSTGFTLHHWSEVLTSGEALHSFLFTLYAGIISLLLAVSLSLLFMTLRKGKSNGWISHFIYLPLTIPAMVAAFFTFQFLSQSGFVSRLFLALHLTHGLEGFPDMVNDSFGIGIIVTHVMLALPFFIILFQNYYHSEKLETLRQLSSTLGSSTSQFNRRILIPVLLKKTAAPLALYFIFILGSYEIPLLLGQQDPQMVSVLVNRKLSRFDLLQIPQGYIVAILYTVLVSVLLFFIVKTKTRSHATA
jgi:putative spermidine/putrescine transport system permease protein